MRLPVFEPLWQEAFSSHETGEPHEVMARVHLIHWNEGEARERAERIRCAGYDVNSALPTKAHFLRALLDDPPLAIVIDLSRMPSLGRDIAVALRHRKTTRNIPLVFVEGDAGKVARIKTILPDAVYTTWRRIESSLKRATARPASEPIAPHSVFAGYSGTPLVKKLGIKAGSAVTLIDAPEDFEKTLGELPAGALLQREANRNGDLVIWFARSSRTLERRIKQVGVRTGKDGLWVVWPKQGSGLATDLTQAVVRKIGLAAGLVDYKISAIDATWSGLRFTRRKPK